MCGAMSVPFFGELVSPKEKTVGSCCVSELLGGLSINEEMTEDGHPRLQDTDTKFKKIIKNILRNFKY